jgi:type III restriction enzyme
MSGDGHQPEPAQLVVQHAAPAAQGRRHDGEFQYYFAQREALETIIYLYDVVGVQGQVRPDALRQQRRGVHRHVRRDLAALRGQDGDRQRQDQGAEPGAGLELFHKLYEPESDLARNFLVIAPNIIVLDRIYKDFRACASSSKTRCSRQRLGRAQLARRFPADAAPAGRGAHHPAHRQYLPDQHPPRLCGRRHSPSPDDENTMDYFLGKRPTGATTDSKVDLGMIVRDIDELMVLNDEAHHIHDPRWPGSSPSRTSTTG